MLLFNFLYQVLFKWLTMRYDFYKQVKFFPTLQKPLIARCLTLLSSKIQAMNPRVQTNLFTLKS